MKPSLCECLGDKVDNKINVKYKSQGEKLKNKMVEKLKNNIVKLKKTSQVPIQDMNQVPPFPFLCTLSYKWSFFSNAVNFFQDAKKQFKNFRSGQQTAYSQK